MPIIQSKEVCLKEVDVNSNTNNIKNKRNYNQPKIDFVELRAEEGIACTASTPIPIPHPPHPSHPPHPPRPRKKWRFRD
ncbi:hypothetical protein DP73_03885 [Desulfosporosinus sp. HMP52]|uniref:hypothetical protein n=1 Tax=Desulfosporosinus sp. HMP52 TaxID=1487923 RepID=UPI00051FBFCA|nr:hypothetical protein [Desulfosporosinus sp. HMP52]KGK91412.1 hypothetical protein DP73_03885 [Desulfosporosinus sp. HMP52]